MNKDMERKIIDEYNVPFSAYGPAITKTFERGDGTLWIGNSEYSSQVNFCPITGYKAKVQIKEEEYFIGDEYDNPNKK